LHQLTIWINLLDARISEIRAMNEDQMIADGLVLAAVRLTRTLQWLTRGGPLTPSQIGALVVIVYAGRIVARDLASYQQVTAATMSRLLSELEAGGMIRRFADKSDSRLQWIEATHVGAAIVKHENARRLKPLVAALRALSAGERADLARAVAVIEKLTEQIAQAA
jgi:DNA-binding MarR family transcriptional regulator